MLDKVKKGLVGLTITDVGMVKKGGVLHALVRLSNSRAIYIPWENVMITDLPIPAPASPVARRPVTRALTMVPPGLKIKAM